MTEAEFYELEISFKDLLSDYIDACHEFEYDPSEMIKNILSDYDIEVDWWIRILKVNWVDW